MAFQTEAGLHETMARFSHPGIGLRLPSRSPRLPPRLPPMTAAIRSLIRGVPFRIVRSSTASTKATTKSSMKSRIGVAIAARFKNWSEGDHLAIIVEKNLAALAEVSGKPFNSRDKVWDNGLFPHRIPLRFTHVLKPKDRPPILGEIRDALTQQWGPRYGWAILNQQALESPHAEIVVRAISARPNALTEYQQNLQASLDEARLKREQANQHKPRRGRRPKAPPLPEKIESEEARLFSKQDASIHTKAQSELITLGRITGCSVWVASNDKSRKYGGKILADECLKKLPNLGLNEEATRRISLIDVIWINQNAPVCAVEGESSTLVYSGLLRISDLLAVIPALNSQI